MAFDRTVEPKFPKQIDRNPFPLFGKFPFGQMVEARSQADLGIELAEYNIFVIMMQTVPVN